MMNVVNAQKGEMSSKITLDNRKVKLQEMVDFLKISKITVFTCFHDNLDMEKVFAKWISCIVPAK